MVTIYKTKKLFKDSRAKLLMELTSLMIKLIMCKEYLDIDDYQRMSALKIELQPFTPDEENDILIDIKMNKRFFWEDDEE